MNNNNNNDRDRRDRGPLRGVSKGDRGGIRRDRFQPKFNARDNRDHKKTTGIRDNKPRVDKGRFWTVEIRDFSFTFITNSFSGNSFSFGPFGRSFITHLSLSVHLNNIHSFN